VPSFAVLGVLVLISGLAAACFSKAFGVVFLGPPRSAAAGAAEEVPAPMRAAMVTLALACAGIGLAAPLVVLLVRAPVAVASGLGPALVAEQLAGAVSALWITSSVFAGVIALALVLRWLRGLGVARFGVRRGPTWGCGYSRPSPRMAYTGSSFAAPLTRAFEPVLRGEVQYRPPEGYFPAASAFRTETPDVFTARLYAPLFHAVDRTMKGLRWLQHGNIHLYVLYIALTLVALLAWELR